MGLRITTWNVNGIRNPFGYAPWNQNRTFQAMFEILEADIVIMQETKIQRKDLTDDMVLVPGWDVYFSLPKHKKGYSGVAIYTRNSKCSPIRAEEGITGTLCPPNSPTRFRDLPEDQQIGGYPKPGQISSSIDEAALDSEGRCVMLEFPAFVVIGVYSPATRDETRTEFRIGFQCALDARIRNLVAMGKQVVVAGDLNIIRDQPDTAGLLEQLRKEGMTVEDFLSTPSRRFLNQLLFGGRVCGGERDEDREEPVVWDLCREFHPAREGMFTCWETKKNARPANFGSRIDYVLCSNGIRDWFVDANIQEGLLGSDHCPVYATLRDVVKAGGKDTHIEDIMNPPGMFESGKRLREWTTKDLLPTSAKLIPEFDRRRNIKDMFFKKSSTATASSSAASSTKDSKTSLAMPLASSVKTSEDAEATNAIQNAPNTLAVCLQEPVGTHPQDSQATPTPSQGTATGTATSSPRASSQKRQAESATSSPSSRPPKKGKPSLTKENSSKSAPGLSQSSLRGFFKPKPPTTSSPAPSKASDPDSEDNGELSATEAIPVRSSSAVDNERKVDSRDAGWETAAVADAAPTGSASTDEAAAYLEAGREERVFDPVENKESWSKLLGKKRAPPRCEHNEPCISLVTKKPGVNCGRSFYICPRPLGPSGQKEKGTEWRCGTFIWSSDWNGAQ